MQRLPDRLLSWASILDDETRRQAERTAALPFVHPYVALTPASRRKRQGGTSCHLRDVAFGS